MKFGLVCISEILKDQKASFQAMTRKTLLGKPREEAIATLSKRILNNTIVTGQIIRHCAENGIWHYRVSSSLMPLITDESIGLSIYDLPDWDLIKNQLASAGAAANELGISLSCHPSQYNVLHSLSPQTVSNTIKELDFQSSLLDLMGCERNLSSPMCLHVARSPKEETPEEFALTFLKNLDLCSEGVQSRLCLENEHGGFWNSANLLKYFPGKTLIYDNLHGEINDGADVVQENIDKFRETWGGATPIFHFSEGLIGAPRSHADYYSNVPEYILNNWDVVWECEVKAKDRAIIKILEEID